MLHTHSLKPFQEVILPESPAPSYLEVFSYKKKIITPFGPHLVTEDESIYFSRGLMGFENLQDFALIPLSELHTSPGPFTDNNHYLLAFCGATPRLSSLPLSESSVGTQDALCYPCFFLYNIPFENRLIDSSDLKTALQNTGVRQGDTSLFLLMTFRGKDQQGNLSVTLNIKAPLVINTHTKQGWQQVLHNSKYALNHPFQPL